MRARDLVRYSRRLTGKGRKRSALVVFCILPLIAELFFRCAEAAVYSLLLYFGQMKPIDLFRAGSIIQLSVMVLCTVIRWLTVYPLSYSAAVRLCEVCTDSSEKHTPYPKILSRSFGRSISAAFCSKLISTASLAPAVFFGVTAYRLILGSLDTNGVFMAVNAVVLTAVSVGVWLSCRVSLSAVPYLLADMPHKNAFAVTFYSLKFMRGRKRVIMRLAVMCLPYALTIIGIPAAVFRFRAAYALAADIFIREDEYSAEEADRTERNKIHGGCSAADDSAKISHRKKRSLKKAAGEA